MRAVVFDRVGRPEEVLQVRDIPPPTPGRGEVLVRMAASPVNPSDLMFVAGNYGLKPTFPATPGFEGVGVVEASGGGLLGWLRTGKRVAVLGTRTGAWAEYAVAPARQVVPVPADIPDDQAASFFVNPATAVALTRHVLRLPPGAWLLQTAAGGALGRMVVRLGRRYGFHTISVVRRPEQIDELKRLGADEVYAEGDDFEQHVGGRAGCAIDPVGGPLAARVLTCLAPGGRLVLFGSLSDQPVPLHPRLVIGGGKRVEGFWLGEWAKRQSVPTMLRLVRRIRRLMRDGVLTTDTGAAFPLDRAADAVREAGSPGKPGKVLLRIGAA